MSNSDSAGIFGKVTSSAKDHPGLTALGLFTIAGAVSVAISKRRTAQVAAGVQLPQSNGEIHADGQPKTRVTNLGDLGTIRDDDSALQDQVTDTDPNGDGDDPISKEIRP